jgi:microcystin-dependent protein
MSQAYIGQIMPFAGNFAIKNWMMCQGQLLPISSYSALFAILGTTYGGNGTTNFALPDLRGRAAIGWGQGPGMSNYVLGQSGGVENAALLPQNLPAHAHTVTEQVTTSKSGAAAVNNTFIDGSLNNFSPNASNPLINLRPVTSSIVGSSVPFSILQPYLAINYIICIYGLFPSRN